MRGDVLVTGGSDGSVRVWSLEKMCPIHRLAAHDNSVTSLQFDDTRVVSGGSDGRVKIWDLKTGYLVRELIAQGEAVWRVAFEDEKCVALALRQGRTIMEVSIFRRLEADGRLQRAKSEELTLGLGLVILPTPGRGLHYIRPPAILTASGCLAADTTPTHECDPARFPPSDAASCCWTESGGWYCPGH